MIRQLKFRTANGLIAGDRQRSSRSGFTLIELLAVVMIILVLAGIMIGVAGYAQKKIGISSTRAQIASIATALEMYKTDWGFYPSTGPARISSSGMWEATNNWILYNALCPTNPGRKTYFRFPGAQIRTNTFIQLPNIYDSWAKPLNYYNSPNTAFAVMASSTNNYGYTLGGQVNVTSYDLFSYGPDGYTFISRSALSAGWTGALWINTNSANDDIWSSGR